MSSLSQNLSKLWQFLDEISISQNFEISQVSSISKYLQLIYSNMGPKTTPSLISRYPPPLAWDEIETPWEIGLKNNLKSRLFYYCEMLIKC